MWLSEFLQLPVLISVSQSKSKIQPICFGGKLHKDVARNQKTAVNNV